MCVIKNVTFALWITKDRYVQRISGMFLRFSVSMKEVDLYWVLWTWFFYSHGQCRTLQLHKFMMVDYARVLKNGVRLLFVVTPLFFILIFIRRISNKCKKKDDYYLEFSNELQKFSKSIINAKSATNSFRFIYHSSLM